MRREVKITASLETDSIYQIEIFLDEKFDQILITQFWLSCFFR